MSQPLLVVYLDECLYQVDIKRPAECLFLWLLCPLALYYKSDKQHLFANLEWGIQMKGSVRAIAVTEKSVRTDYDLDMML